MSPRNARLPDLPDVPTDEFRQVETDRFRELTTARINSARFLASTSQALADAQQQANGLRRADRLEPSHLAPTGDAAGQQDAAPSPAASGMPPGAPRSLEGPSVAARTTFGTPAPDIAAPASAADSFRAWAGNQIDSARSKLAMLGFAPDTSPTPTDALLKTTPGVVATPDQAGGPTVDAYERGRQVSRQGGVYLPPTSGLTGQNFGQEAANVLEAERNRTRPMLGPGGGLGIYNPNVVPETGLGNAAPEEATAAAGELAGGVPVVGGLLKFLAHPGDVFGGGGNLAKRPPTVDEALTTARDAWTRVSTIADSLGIDLTGHAEYLRNALPSATTPAEHIGAYTTALSDAVGQIRDAVARQIEPLQAQVDSYRETALPELARWGRAFVESNGEMKENIPLSLWQRVSGDARTLSPTSLFKRNGTVYVKPEYVMDEFFQTNDALNHFGKQFETLGDFQRAMYDARQKDDAIRAAASQIKELTAADATATAAYHAALPDEALLAAPATAGQPTTLPTQGSAGQTGTQAALIPGAAPATGGVVSPTVAPTSTAAPGLLGQIAGRLGLGKVASAANQLLAPALNTPPAVQSAIEDFANSRMQNAVQADTAVRQAVPTVPPGDALLVDQLLARIKAAGPDAAVRVTPTTPSPAGWERGGALHPNLTGYALSPDVATAVRNVLTTPRYPALVGGAQNVLGEAKAGLFSLGVFHLVTELRQAIRANGTQGLPVIAKAVQAALSPASFNHLRLTNAVAFSDAARAGVTGLVSRAAPDVEGALAHPVLGAAARGLPGGVAAGASTYLGSKASGADEQTARDRALLAGGLTAALGATVAKPLSDALWERAIPTMKMMTYQIQREAGADPQAAARFTNNVFGGQNLAAIARSPVVQDVARTAFLAPDWWESWGRQVASTLQGGSTGQMSRAYWARTAVEAAVLVEGLNYALNGHSSADNEPGHQLELETSGLFQRLGGQGTDPRTGTPQRTYQDVLGPIKTLLEAPSDPGKFGRGRLGLLPTLGAQAILNVNARGQKIVPPGTPWPIGAAEQVGNALQRVAPVGAQQIDQAGRSNVPLPAAIVGAVTGMRPSVGGQAPVLDSALPGSSQAILRSAGVAYTPGPIGRSIRGVPLLASEQARYQTLANQYRDVALHDQAADPEWKTLTPAEAERAAKSAVARADARAANEVLQAIPDAEIARRKGQGGK